MRITKTVNIELSKHLHSGAFPIPEKNRRSSGERRWQEQSRRALHGGNALFFVVLYRLKLCVKKRGDLYEEE